MRTWYNGEIIDQVEAQLVLPWPAAADAQEAMWHADALPAFIEADTELHPELIAGILNLSRRLLHELSAEESITTYLSDPTNPAHSEPIRRFRKLMMIGRDALRATSDFQNKNNDPINRLCHSLGELGDSETEKPVYAELAANALEALPTSLIAVDGLEPINTYQVYDKLNSRLTYLGLHLDHSKYSSENYHRNRIGFRRVVHFGILSNIVSPTPEKSALIGEGLYWNYIYGERHTAMRLKSGQLPDAPNIG